MISSHCPKGGGQACGTDDPLKRSKWALLSLAEEGKGLASRAADQIIITLGSLSHSVFKQPPLGQVGRKDSTHVTH